MPEKPKLEFASSSQRRKLAPECPCGEPNKNGRFSPDIHHPGCGFCHTCKQVFLPDKPDTPHQKGRTAPERTRSTEPEPLAFAGWDKVRASASPLHWNINPFAQWFIELGRALGSAQAAKDILVAYYLGTTKDGGTLFWLIDHHGNPRQPRKSYYHATGKRDQKTHPGIPPRGYTRDSGYRPCMFGAHLLQADTSNVIHLVESEKNALCGALIGKAGQQYAGVWLATCGGQAGGNKLAELGSLEGYTVNIYPHADDTGRTGAQRLMQQATKQGVSDGHILELAPDRTDGYDIADFVADFAAKHGRKLQALAHTAKS